MAFGHFNILNKDSACHFTIEELVRNIAPQIQILKNAFPAEDHAVLAALVDGEWLILDNRTLALVRDSDITRAVPELVLDQEGVRRFVAKGRKDRATG